MGSPVTITVPELIALKGAGAALKLGARRRLADQSGGYISTRKGRGMEFDESRLYQAGDDIRNMDWRVTARTGEAHTKLYREERERPVFVWVDLRASMFFATRGVYKSVFAAQLATLIGWQAAQQGDRIGGLVFSENSHHELRPGLGKPAVLHLIKRLVSHPAWQSPPESKDDHNTTIKQALMRLNRLVRPGSLVFMISDFRGAESAQSEFARLSKHGEMVLVPIRDQLELTLPKAGNYRMTQASQELVINTQDEKMRETYAEKAQTHDDWLNDIAGRYRMRILPCLTDDDPFKKLMAYAQ